MPKGPTSQERRDCKEVSSGQKGVAKRLDLAPSTLETRIQAARHRQFPVPEQRVILRKSRLRQLLGVRCLVTALVRGGSTPATSASTQFATGCDRSQPTKAPTRRRTPRRSLIPEIN